MLKEAGELASQLKQVIASIKTQRESNEVGGGSRWARREVLGDHVEILGVRWGRGRGGGECRAIAGPSGLEPVPGVPARLGE